MRDVFRQCTATRFLRTQGKCPFGDKCNYPHEDPEGDDGELKAKNDKFAEEWQRKNKHKRKRHQPNADDPLGSSDEEEEEEEEEAKPAAKVSLH